MRERERERKRNSEEALEEARQLAPLFAVDSRINKEVKASACVAYARH